MKLQRCGSAWQRRPSPWSRSESGISMALPSIASARGAPKMLNEAEMIDRAIAVLFAPGVDSDLRPYALVDGIEKAATPSAAWQIFQRGWTCCDAVSPRVIDDIMKVLLDRKSTRLNFSHVKISYAVF